jgi:hypothetical protein
VRQAPANSETFWSSINEQNQNMDDLKAEVTLGHRGVGNQLSLCALIAEILELRTVGPGL